MNSLKKEILLVSVTCVLGIITLVEDVILHPLDYSENASYSVLVTLSGYHGMLAILMGGLALFTQPSWLVFVSPFLGSFFFPLTMVFSKGIFVVKRIVFSYFITMYATIILFYFTGYLVILKII